MKRKSVRMSIFLSVNTSKPTVFFKGEEQTFRTFTGSRHIYRKHQENRQKKIVEKLVKYMKEGRIEIPAFQLKQKCGNKSCSLRE